MEGDPQFAPSLLGPNPNESDSDASSGSVTPLSSLSPRQSTLWSPALCEEGTNFVALSALALKQQELQRNSSVDYDNALTENRDNAEESLVSPHQPAIVANINNPPENGTLSASNRHLQVRLPTGEVLASVVCPFDDKVHYDARTNLSELSSLELAEDNSVFSADFAELSFTCRILAMAMDPEVPLLERFKFLCIVSMNIDELFSKKLGNQVNVDPNDLEYFSHIMSQNVRPKTLYENHLKVAYDVIIERQYRCFEKDIRPALSENGIHIVRFDELRPEERKKMNQYFTLNLLPLLTPIVLDSHHAFPLLESHTVYTIAQIAKGRDGSPGNVLLRVPPGTTRLIPLDGSDFRYITVEDVILANIGQVCFGMIAIKAYPFRVTRNIKLELEDDMFGDVYRHLDYVVDECHRRRGAPATRLEVLADTPPIIIKQLTSALSLDESDVFYIPSDLLDLGSCISLSRAPAPMLRENIEEPVVPSAFKGLLHRVQTRPHAIFDVIRNDDVMVEYPKESFRNSAVLFLQAAARDPQVCTIKTVLYRCGSNSPIVSALIRAAKNRKEVTVLIELKASFDEVRNSEYARQLQMAGCNVVYGVRNLKVHCKTIIVVRKESNGRLVKYSSISTGNFNPGTAKLYTDISLYTCRQDIGNDLLHLFNTLTGFGAVRNYESILVAPTDMLNSFVDLIRTEAINAKRRMPARIVAQINGLTDKTIVRELYDASQAGVKIDLIVRGQCRLRPEIPGRSDNIRVFSWLGPILQHRRIFFFLNGGNGKEKFFIGSADWRTRNLNERIEVVLPVKDRALCKRLLKTFNIVNDVKNTWRMSWDGRYYKGIPNTNNPPVASAMSLPQCNAGVRRPLGSSSDYEFMHPQLDSFVKLSHRPRNRIEVNIHGESVTVDKVASAALPIRFPDSDRPNVDAMEVLLVRRVETSRGSATNDPWSVPKGGLLEGESHEEATLRIAREKSGIFKSEVVENMGWVLRTKKKKVIAVQPFVQQVIELGRFPGSSQVRERAWFPVRQAIDEAHNSGNEFAQVVLKRAIRALRDKFEDKKRSTRTMSSGSVMNEGSTASAQLSSPQQSD